MNIWICKAFGLAVLALSACSTAPPEAGEDDLAPPLTSAKMMRGVAVQAPDGFCFDRSSLARQFALLARCDTLGMRGTRLDTPVAVITMTIAKGEGGDLPAPDALIAENETLLETDNRDLLQLMKIDGVSPHDGLSGRHWRGVGQIGDSLVMGLAIYPSDTGEGLGSQGPQLLEQAFTRTSEGIAQGPLRGQSSAGGEKKPAPAWLAGLFNGNKSAR